VPAQHPSPAGRGTAVPGVAYPPDEVTRDRRPPQATGPGPARAPGSLGAVPLRGL